MKFTLLFSVAFASLAIAAPQKPGNALGGLPECGGKEFCENACKDRGGIQKILCEIDGSKTVCTCNKDA